MLDTYPCEVCSLALANQELCLQATFDNDGPDLKASGLTMAAVQELIRVRLAKAEQKAGEKPEDLFGETDLEVLAPPRSCSGLWRGSCIPAELL